MSENENQSQSAEEMDFGVLSPGFVPPESEEQPTTEGASESEGNQEGSTDEISEVVPYAEYSKLVENLKKTNKAAGKTSENLDKSRKREKELEAELRQIRGQADPEGAEQTGSPVQYNQEPGISEYYDRETFQQVMGQFSENWKNISEDDLLSSGLEGVGRMMMNGLGNLTARIEQMDRQFKMQELGMDQSSIQAALSTPGLEHLANLEPEQIAEVLTTFENIAASRRGTGPSPEGGQPAAPAQGGPGGAPRTVRRDPRHHQDPTRSVGGGSITPDQALRAELAASGGASRKAREMGTDLFTGMIDTSLRGRTRQ